MLYGAMIVSYLVGSLSFAIIISRLMKMDDPRSYGSGNAGATNVMRGGNKKAAILTLLCDMLKGFVVVLIAKHFFEKAQGGASIVAICGILVVLGHIYPIFFKFKGGKGVATAIGAILGFNPWVALLLVATWLLIFLISRISSLSALVATLLSPVYAFMLMGNSPYFAAILIIAFFVLYKHKANILRILTGKEDKFANKYSDTTTINK